MAFGRLHLKLHLRHDIDSLGGKRDKHHISNFRGWRIIRADGSCRHVCALWGRRSMHATICMPWASMVALWRVEDPTLGADHDFASSSRLIRFS